MMNDLSLFYNKFQLEFIILELLKISGDPYQLNCRKIVEVISLMDRNEKTVDLLFIL